MSPSTTSTPNHLMPGLCAVKQSSWLSINSCLHVPSHTRVKVMSHTTAISPVVPVTSSQRVAECTLWLRIQAPQLPALHHGLADAQVAPNHLSLEADDDGSPPVAAHSLSKGAPAALP
jgi:hypothetical protein